MRKGWRTQGGEGQPCNKQCWEKWTPHPKVYPRHCLHCTQNWLKTNVPHQAPWVVWKQQSFCTEEASPNFWIYITFSSWHCLGHQETQLSSVSMLPCVVLKPNCQWVPRSLSSSQQRRWLRCPYWSLVVPEETQLLSAALKLVCRVHADSVCYLSVMWAQCHSLVSMESASHAFLTGHWTQCPLLAELLSPLNW